MYNYKRLHPFVILKRSTSWVFSFSLLIAFDVFRNIESKSSLFYSIAILGSLFFLAFIFNLYRWFTFKYAITSTNLSIKSGIFFKREKTIPFSRIQSIHQKTWFLFRPFNLVSITIETASSSSKIEDIVLEVVTRSTYNLLENLRLGKENTIDSGKTQIYMPQYSVSLNNIIIFSLIDLDVISVILGLITIVYPFSHFAYKYLNSFLSKLFTSGILILTFVLITVVTLTILGTIIKNIFKYYKFTVYRELNHIIIKRGFFTRTTLSIPIERIQAIRINSSLLQMLLNIKTVELLLASGTTSEAKEDASDTNFFLFPIINGHLLTKKLMQILPEFTNTKIIQKKPHTVSCPPHYFLSSRFRFLNLLLLVPLFFWSGNWYILFSVIILFFTLLSFINSIWQTKSQAVTYYEKELLMIRTVLFFTRTEYLCPLNKIQTISISTTPFLYYQKLGHISFVFKTGESASTIKLKYLSWKTCETIRFHCAPRIKNYTLIKKEVQP